MWFLSYVFWVELFLSYKAPISLYFFGFHQIPMRISFSPVSLQEKWYNNITFLIRKFTKLRMDSLATSCYIISNTHKETKKKKIIQPSWHACQTKQQPGRSSEPDVPLCLSLLFKVLPIRHATATTRNTIATPSQIPSIGFSVLQLHTEIDPRSCCCLRRPPAPPLLRAQPPTQQIQNRTRISSSRWT